MLLAKDKNNLEYIEKRAKCFDYNFLLNFVFSEGKENPLDSLGNIPLIFEQLEYLQKLKVIQGVSKKGPLSNFYKEWIIY